MPSRASRVGAKGTLTTIEIDALLSRLKKHGFSDEDINFTSSGGNVREIDISVSSEKSEVFIAAMQGKDLSEIGNKLVFIY